MIGKAFYMHFIDYSPGKRAFQRHVAFPIITMGIGNEAFHGAMGIVAGLESRIPIVLLRNCHPFAIGVQQDFIRIKAKTFVRIIGAVCPICI